MKTKQNIRSIAVMIIAIALHLVLAVPVMATTGEASEEVLDAQNGVVRIMITAEDGVGVGTGFAVGEEGNIYIVTNHHVIADAEYPELRH